ncbi:hypothetical protein CFOL_v3_15343 [Cephalotus follicularis]|uniref:Uncharacterized protein n=1 Tax=Cephalotus follicularis TaxID=3775 RepID=A0A1Q3BV30_CEPFO|nr:hypothetical protein CFOL_v3_15343 [Cephalotus follicularis]
MSLTLLQGYSSPEEEEEEEEEKEHFQHQNSTENDELQHNDDNNIPLSPQSFPSVNSALPSAFDAFSQISKPPEFLNNTNSYSAIDFDRQQGRHSRRWNHKKSKDLPASVVVEAKPQLVGMHERVRSDIESNQPPTKSVSSTAEGGGKRVATATNPDAQDAADLLRMCLQCGIPKTFSNTRGMVCPVCGDRPATDASNEPKKKGSVIKDKEKSKRMKGQSSHATWKSETEMQLRQQFD